MDYEKEQKFFYISLWAFLAGSIAFLVSFLSLGNTSLPSPLWLMFILLDAGFIAFIVLPPPGKMLLGKGGQLKSRKKWYPKKLEDIVGPGLHKKKGIREDEITAPGGEKEPVLVISLLLLMGLILLLFPAAGDRDSWKREEISHLEKIYTDAQERLEDVESFIAAAADKSGKIVEDIGVDKLTRTERAYLIREVDSVARGKYEGVESGNEIGVQIYTKDGERVAWGGKPRFLGEMPHSSRGTFAAKTKIYTLLIKEQKYDWGRVVVDTPVEVNYVKKNRFIRQRGLEEILSAEHDAKIDFTFQVGGVRRQDFPGDVGDEKEPKVYFDPNGEIGFYGVINSAEGFPLARLRVRGRSFNEVQRLKKEKKALTAGLLLTLIVTILAIWIYRTYSRRKLESGKGFWFMLRRVALLLFFLSLIRHILLSLNMPSSFLGTNLFDPVMYMDDMPGGLFRTTGDFLLTSLFGLFFVFGSIKVFRTFYPGVLERRILRAGSFNPAIAAGKIVLLAAFLFSGTVAASELVSRLVRNANPKIVGLDIGFFETPVLSLHLALLFAVSAIFIVLIFVSRLILAWKNGGLKELVLVIVLTVSLLAFLLNGNWTQLVPVAAILLMSLKIFPMLRKEEIITVIFSSFFLVLIFSLLIYGTARGGYDRLKKRRIREMVDEFNHPEDSWIGTFLPDVCRDISHDKNVSSLVDSEEESAAFEIWTGSNLGKFDLPCLIDVYNNKGNKFSTFSLGIPLGIARDLPGDKTSFPGPRVIQKREETNKGAAYYFIGVSPIYSIEGKQIGKVEIKIPYFFENTGLLARRSPETPEIFHKEEKGGFRRRVDEPHNLLVARIESGAVEESSSPFLYTGAIVPGKSGEWFEIDAGEKKYRCIMDLDKDEKGYLVGYQIPGLAGRTIEWATVVSLEVILTIFSLVVLFVIRKLPVLGSVTPDVTFSGALGFKQKLLLSFFIVSILPVVAMGAFSNRFIKKRYKAEANREAEAGVESAFSLIEHSIKSEAESFAGSQYLNDILEGKESPRIRDISREEVTQFTLFTGSEILLDESLSNFRIEDALNLFETGRMEEVTITYSPPYLFGGVVIPISIPGASGGYLYYRRRMDDEFVGGIAQVLGKNVNIYYKGMINASSQRDLFTGGFLNALMEPLMFADAALGGGRTVIGTESLGEYSYHVAGISMKPLKGSVLGVLSVPLLYQATLVQKEIHKTRGLLMGLLALLFAASVTLGVFLAGRIFTPIAQLRGGTRKIIEGDLEFKLEAGAPDEIGELVDSFNSMTTGLREARRELLDRQKYLATILDNAATGVITSDESGTIITFNPAGEKILNISREGVIGTKPSDIKREELRPFFDLFSLGRARGEVREVDLYSDEAKRTIKAVVTSLPESGGKAGTVVVFDDLTELIRSKKLSAWVEMARQIAHEVKNPLTPIKLSAQFMRRAYGKKDEKFEEIFKSGIDTIMKHTDILRRIASEFSSFGRVSELKAEKVQLNEFIEEQISSYRGIEKIDIVFQPDGEIEVNADREGLRKVFNNLIENSIEAIEGPGRIVVKTSRVDDKALIKVLDTGTGLSSEVEEKLFEPYFSTKTTGTGLGLAICRNIVDQMAGEIILRNRTDTQGVEVIVTLPSL
ncbi:MAG: ATP-binding protein [Candidatus Krumholzibacteriota bacterium]|nr:ATP-binding protein [Candidatus Krumholzibacteriota bacterium]